jgi:hypothetical protein
MKSDELKGYETRSEESKNNMKLLHESVNTMKKNYDKFLSAAEKIRGTWKVCGCGKKCKVPSK